MLPSCSILGIEEGRSEEKGCEGETNDQELSELSVRRQPDRPRPLLRWFNKLKLPSRRPPGPDITRLFANPLLPFPILSHGGCEPDITFSDCRCQNGFLSNFSVR